MKDEDVEIACVPDKIDAIQVLCINDILYSVGWYGWLYCTGSIEEVE